MRLFEDFVPLSDNEALITTGVRLDALDRVERVRYEIVGDRVVTRKSLGELARGTYLRLGGIFGGELVFSDGYHGPHQPFVHEGARYYTDDWPLVRIYRDGELFLDHFAEMLQVANPCWVGDVMYFEARATDDPERPDAWKIWRRLPTGDVEYVCVGANPSHWNGRLFVGTWNGKSFDYRCRPIAD